MTSRNEWEEYFELVNDRKPSADEIAAALQRGEFAEGTGQENFDQRAHEDARKAEERVSEGAERAKEQANVAFNSAKKHAGNYFAWFKNRALHPTNYINEEEPNKLYLWLSFAFTSILSAGIFWNVIRRIFDAFYNYMTSEYSRSDAQNVSNLAGRVLPSAFFDFLIAFVILFLASLAGLALASRGKESFKALTLKYLTFQPTAMIFAILGFLYSFVASIPSINNINDIESAIQGIAVNVGILVVLPLLAVAVTTIAATYFVQIYRQNDQKFDLIWWQMIQAVITGLVIYIGYAVIVAPMFKSLISTLMSGSNF
ncbi:hypothetical protein [Fructobacillus papyrifericola]|uniref:Yip1 domain-containing protein n=1 Tax=Fructobacillus papyrifericola TaxID=2713172 RepID=A0ABS5QUD9_9LACO|nr:hypothetical protein [Fructobacillus papyrifericola]MBS9336804.1 hypothetical protein [Fructobacillus papyrifericola]